MDPYKLEVVINHILEGGGGSLYLQGICAPPLVPLFQELRYRSRRDDQLANRLRKIRVIKFAFHNTEDLSDIDIGSLLPNLQVCHFYDCEKISSLKKFTDIVTLERLYCYNCPSITSLSSLSSLPRESRLRELHIRDCNLNPTHGDDWEDAFQAIGNATGSNDFKLRIWGDKAMTFLPSSIRYLKAKMGEVAIELRHDKKLQRLSCDIGQLPNMVDLDIGDCDSFTTLPWTLGRLHPTCKVCTNSYRHPQTVEEMQPQFKDSRQRFISGLAKLSILSSKKKAKVIHELYKPGGKGYKRAREHFETAVSDMNAEQGG